MNIFIALIGVAGIILARRLVLNGTGMGIKPHLIILGLKLIISFAIVLLFVMYSEKNNWVVLILTGLVNIITFHFVEAFVTQKKLINHKGINV